MPGTALGARGLALIIVFHVFSVFVMVFVIASAPDPSGQVALVYSPFAAPGDPMRQAAETGGRIVRLGRRPWIVVVAPDPANPVFSAQARASGALLQLNPVIAGGCPPKRANLARS